MYDMFNTFAGITRIYKQILGSYVYPGRSSMTDASGDRIRSVRTVQITNLLTRPRQTQIHVFVKCERKNPIKVIACVTFSLYI